MIVEIAAAKERNIASYKRVSSNRENESEIVDAFQFGLRVLADPKDRLHLSALAKKWQGVESSRNADSPWPSRRGVLSLTESQGHAGSMSLGAPVVSR